MEKKDLPSVRMISGGVIVYTRNEGVIKILLLEQNNKRYERKGRKAKKRVIDIGPSGRLEEGENTLQAARRELKQETNLDLEIEDDYTDSYSYVFEGEAYEGKDKGKRAKIIKTRKYYLASATGAQLANLKLSDEHVSYRLVTIDEALKSKEITKPQKQLLKRLKERFGIPPTNVN
jgi:8-oxo-dGTP pyrophosphatase MutT (NUDIX family)